MTVILFIYYFVDIDVAFAQDIAWKKYVFWHTLWHLSGAFASCFVFYLANSSLGGVKGHDEF